MSQTSAPPKVKDETWQAYRAALTRLLVEMAPPAATGDGARNVQEGDVKRMVTEAVGAVLLGGNVIEKVLVHSLQKLSEEDRKKVGDALVPQDSLRKLCEEAFRSMTLHHLLPALQKQLKEKLNQQLVEIGKTEEFKSLIDSRFRMMEQYLRSDVIPKVVEKCVGQRG
jgi:hypothetical protein